VCDDRLGPVWSPDGRSIVFSRDFGHVKTGRPFGPRGQIAHSELFVMDAGGSHLRRITHLTTSRAYSADVGRPTWSPDGARLAFNVAKSPRGRPPRGQALFIVRADGSGLKRLTPWKLHTGEHPDFSPDGRQILFAAGARGSHDRGGNLYTVHPDGSGLTQLTHGGRSGLVAAGSYSPDGASLAFVQLRPHEQFLTSLFVMSTDGTGLREVTKPDAVADPDWGAGPAG
jgi:TolB protein